MDKLVVLKLNGEYDKGLLLTLEIGQEGKYSETEITGSLPPATELVRQYEEWQEIYRRLKHSFRLKYDLNDSFKFKQSQTTNPGKIHINDYIQRQKQECRERAKRLKKQLNQWLDSVGFRRIDRRLQEQLQPGDKIRFLIRTSSSQLRKLPWHLWDFLERYPFSEIAFSALEYQRPTISKTPANQVRILAILGNSPGIDVLKDKEELLKLTNAKITILEEPQRQHLNTQLWENPWDILFFAGHSQTEGQKGQINLNKNDSLSIEEIKSGVKKAIEKGLQLAIFNSCDGLGLASELERLNIPQMIVMREPVPDTVAQEFLTHFLSLFASGIPLHLAVRSARKRLQDLEDEFPCASWLPVICQNPAFVPPTWSDLVGKKLSISNSYLSKQKIERGLLPRNRTQKSQLNPQSLPVPTALVADLELKPQGLLVPTAPVADSQLKPQGLLVPTAPVADSQLKSQGLPVPTAPVADSQLKPQGLPVPTAPVADSQLKPQGLPVPTAPVADSQLEPQGLPVPTAPVMDLELKPQGLPVPTAPVADSQLKPQGLPVPTAPVADSQLKPQGLPVPTAPVADSQLKPQGLPVPTAPVADSQLEPQGLPVPTAPVASVNNYHSSISETFPDRSSTFLETSVKKHNRKVGFNYRGISTLAIGALFLLEVIRLITTSATSSPPKLISTDSPKNNPTQVNNPQTSPIVFNNQRYSTFSQLDGVPSGTFRYGGSTAWSPIRSKVHPAIESAWPEFNLLELEHPTIAPSSSIAVQMLLHDHLHVAHTSRPLQPEEYQQANEYGFQIKHIPVAIDGIAFAVNPNLNIPGLTLAQLRDIYTGKITNWKQVGGPNLKIIPYSKSPQVSGTAEFFVSHLLSEEKFGSNVKLVTNTNRTLKKLATNRGGIFYASAPEIIPHCSVKALPIGNTPEKLISPISPYQKPLSKSNSCVTQHNQANQKAFLDASYPLTRYLYVIVKQNGGIDQQAGEIYTQLLLSEQGQKLIEKTGFVPIR